MVHLPSSLPDAGALDLVVWLYVITNATRAVTYIPQIVVVWRCNDGARSVSLLTWGSWVLANVSAVLYAYCVVGDLPLVLISVVNLLGCAAVTGLALHRRVRWKQSQELLHVLSMRTLREHPTRVDGTMRHSANALFLSRIPMRRIRHAAAARRCTAAGS
jgi:hypothetical protein